MPGAATPDARDVAGFSLASPPDGFVALPYPWYHALRTHSPVHALGPDSVFLTRYEDVDRNIDDLLLRLTGIDGDAAAPYRARLAEVYREASGSPRGAAAGWEAVCIAVLTSPEFLLY